MLPDARNQIHIIAQYDEIKNVVAERKNPARDPRIQNIGHETLPNFRKSFPSWFCIPDGTSLIFFQVVMRTTSKMDRRHESIEQTIELKSEARFASATTPRKIEGIFLFFSVSGNGPDIKKRRRSFGRKHILFRRFSGLNRYKLNLLELKTASRTARICLRRRLRVHHSPEKIAAK